MKLKSMNNILSMIRNCDVILKNGQEQYVGLYFDMENFEQPIVLFKYNSVFNYFLLKALELMPVPCVEHKILAKALFENTTEGDYIDDTYIQAVAKVYSNLPKFKDTQESFDEELNNDLVTQLYQLEEDIFKCAEKNFIPKIVDNEDKHISIDDARELLDKNIIELSEEYGMECKIIHNDSNSTYEYYLATVIKEYDFDLWLIVMFLSKERKFYIGNRSVFRSFDLCETENAIEYVKHLLQITNVKLKREIKIFCKEFKLNPRLYAITNNSIKTMLEMNYKYTEIEYGINFSMKTYVMIYLEGKVNTQKMFKICISYNEFLRNPNALKRIVQKPKYQNKWNFWCHKIKYNKDCFEEQFRNIRES